MCFESMKRVATGLYFHRSCPVFMGLFLHPWNGGDGFNPPFEFINQLSTGPSWQEHIVKFQLARGGELESSTN